MTHDQSTVRNRLLKALPCADYELLQPQLESVQFELRQVICRPGDELTEVYFPLNGILSVIAQSPDDRIEIGMVGPDGAGGVATVFGATTQPFTMLCQARCTALRIPAARFRDAAQQSAPLLALCGRYLHYMSIQAGQTAYANASLNIEARLARWVLMTDDRTDGYELPLTHEFIAMMLGTRRPGVTTAIHVLEGANMIRAERGLIIVTDRAKLIDLASDAYGLAESEYERLIC